MLSPCWQSFVALEHKPLNLCDMDCMVMLEAPNHCRWHDGTILTTRAVALTDRDAGKVPLVRIHTGASAVSRQACPRA